MPGENYHQEDNFILEYGVDKFEMPEVLGWFRRDEDLAKKYITTVYESSEHAVNYEEILSNAKRVLFLGFGYLSDNLEKLGLYKDRDNIFGPRYKGTAYGLPKTEADEVTELGIELVHTTHDCLEFFHTHERVVPKLDL